VNDLPQRYNAGAQLKMTQPAKDSSPAAPINDPRFYLSVEQNFLAWIRTGIALMGFGFILARFGIFLRQIQWMRKDLQGEQYGATIWLGVTLVGMGVASMIAAASRHVRMVRSLREGRPGDFNRASTLAITIAIALACIGLITAIYLIVVNGSTAI
jgi:putative membrane protein